MRIKKRIKTNLLIISTAITACIVLAVSFLTNPKDDTTATMQEADKLTSLEELEQGLEEQESSEKGIKSAQSLISDAASEEEIQHSVLYEGEFDNIMGYSGSYVYYDVHPLVGYYYSDDGILLAQVWGTKPEDVVIIDIDADGKNELISNLIWSDGGTDVVIYKAFSEEIKYAYCTDLLDEPYDNLGVGTIGAEYNRKTNRVKIFYWVDAEQKFREKEYEINLNLLTWWNPAWVES